MTADTSQPTEAGAPDVIDAYPLTPMQFGMVFESTLSGRPWANLEQIVCWFDDEDVDVGLLEEAWARSQRRHPALRTSIRWDGPDLGEPVQEVHAEAPLPVAVQVWTTGQRGDDLDAALERWLAADREEGIDVGAAPAMRLTLLRTGARSSIFVWTFPHALLDGRSFTIVIEEVFDAYDALRAGDTPPEVPAPPSFREHVEAVRRVDTDGARMFFTELLEGIDEPLPIPGGLPVPADEPGRPGSGVRHAEHELRIGADLFERLERRAARAGATVGSMLLTAWAILLSRYTARFDVVFGSTRSGRHTHVAGALIVGCLINTIPFRVRARPDRTVDELLGDVRRLQVAVRPHEQASLMDVRTWSEVPNDQPLVNTNVVFERQLLESHLRAKGGPWTTRRVAVREETSFPLGLAAYQDEGGLQVRLEYEAGRYRPATIERMGRHMAGLLESIVSSGEDTKVAMLRMMPPDERIELLDGRNPSEQPAVVRTVVDGLERAAGDHPTRPALVDVATGATELDHATLDAAANRMAHHLRAVGAAPGPVALCLPRSTDFVVAMLGAMKAGVPYVPIDPSYPESTVEHMLTDSGATVVVTSTALAPMLPPSAATHVVVDDPMVRASVAAEPSDAPSRAHLGLDHPAYVIYTSGSTGKPKGVAVSHRALAAYCDAVASRYELTSADRVLQFSSLSFDVSIEELLPTLLRGAAIVLRSPAMAESMPELLEGTERLGLTVLNLPTAFWHTLVEHLEQLDEAGREIAFPPSVRLLVTGGERASRRAYGSWRSLVPGVRWLNGYGPTETTVTCTVFDPGQGYEPGPDEELPIGRPLANTRAYVLGGDGQWPMPEGMVGELWIGGSSVAIGYLGQPELTEERFRPDVFGGGDGARMYRTGDLARWLPSGDLEFLGRVDRQVKVRGFRIEPGEVEAALERHPAVRRAFVATREAETGDARLIGWIVPSGVDNLDLDDVLATVRSQLPAHMVPAALVRVERLVKTPGGKVDVSALPSPEVAGMPAGGGAHDPGTKAVADLFRDVLGWEGRIGPDDSFFHLGGHSLLAVRLLGRIERDHGVRLSLATLHEGPTPRRVWAAVQQLVEEGATGARRRRREDDAYLVPIQPEGSRPPIFGVHVLGSNACYYRPLAERLGPDQPVLGLSIAEPGDDTPTAIEEIAALYAAEIERSYPEGPLSLAAVSMGSFVAFELAHQLRRRGREVLAVILFDAAGPGGRPSVTKAERVRIHLHQLREVGPSYLVGRWRRVEEVGRERVDALRLKVHRRRGRETPEELWMHQFVMANVRAANAYEAEPYPGRIIVVRALGELFDAPSNARTGLGWSTVAAGQFDVLSVPGQHLTMLAEPAVAELAAELRRTLDEVD